MSFAYIHPSIARPIWRLSTYCWGHHHRNAHSINSIKTDAKSLFGPPIHHAARVFGIPNHFRAIEEIFARFDLRCLSCFVWMPTKVVLEIGEQTMRLENESKTFAFAKISLLITFNKKFLFQFASKTSAMRSLMNDKIRRMKKHDA